MEETKVLDSEVDVEKDLNKTVSELETVVGGIIEQLQQISFHVFMSEVLIDHIAKKIGVTDEELQQIAKEVNEKILSALKQANEVKIN